MVAFKSLEALRFYASQTRECRYRVLLEYFDEDLDPVEGGSCGNCDICRNAVSGGLIRFNFSTAAHLLLQAASDIVRGGTGRLIQRAYDASQGTRLSNTPSITRPLLEDLLPILVSHDYLKREYKSADIRPLKSLKTFVHYEPTDVGIPTLNENLDVLLLVRHSPRLQRYISHLSSNPGAAVRTQSAQNLVPAPNDSQRSRQLTTSEGTRALEVAAMETRVLDPLRRQDGPHRTEVLDLPPLQRHLVPMEFTVGFRQPTLGMTIGAGENGNSALPQVRGLREQGEAEENSIAIGDVILGVNGTRFDPNQSAEDLQLELTGIVAVSQRPMTITFQRIVVCNKFLTPVQPPTPHQYLLT